MVLNETIHNWIDCWKSTLDEGYYISDEEQAASWNKRAESFGKDVEEERQRKKNADFFNLLEKSGFNPVGAQILDIGCGPGTLSIPLAQAGAQVTSLDISSGMLERLKKIADRDKLPITPVECSWWTADIDALGLRNSFDLVIASFTPGIKDVETFDRMMACSRRFCYYSNFIRKDPAKIPSEIYTRILDTIPQDNIFASGFMYPFMYLYTLGFRPIVKITHKLEDRYQSAEEAAEKAIDFLLLRHDLTEEIKEKIREYYRNSSISGMYHTQSDIYKGMMIWSIA
ncbi:MAG: Mg-protoporphyrin IX methyl transferase [Euryarchaeota archaeon ADurb.Bin294]|jgi:ubiquinone/menaquinone biosynthesis C-methylase UbiE|nr:class I SAM-dependent methyltransferase [Methanomicrobiales archaeon]OQA56004.1 MAG: Mg-protoporphyrin IX methyl transferase [Euryarchaeota archaeon ADurb.Bin294]